MNKIDNLMMLGHDSIDYQALLPQELADLILANEDFFVSTSALAELSMREHSLAGEVASQIFAQNLGDQWIQAAAFDELYKWKKSEALNVFDNIIEDAPLVVLDAVIMCIDSEEVDSYKKDPYLNSLVYRLIKRIKAVGQNNLDDPQVADFLFEHFPELKEKAYLET